MPRFTYIAKDQQDSIERGEIRGDSPAAARQVLQQRGLRLVGLEPVQEKLTWAQQVEGLLGSRPRSIRSRDLELVQQQLAVMLESGLELAPSLRELGRHAACRSVQRLCKELAQEVELGSSFTKAIADSKAFPFLVAQLIGVGEESGELPATLHRSAEFMEKRRETASGLVAALAYPTVVAAAAFSVAGYLVGWAIPKLSTFLLTMGRSLPPMTQSLIDISNSVRAYGLQSTVAMVAFAVALGLLYLWPTARYRIDQATLRIPGIGRLIRMAETQLLASSLALMLRSGMLLQDALKTSSRLHRNQYLAKSVARSNERLSSGHALATSLDGFEPMLTSMVAVGERTGELPRALEHVAKLYQSQLDTRLKQLSRLVEPAIIIFVGGIVGYVYIAFFMALMSAGGNFK